MRRLGQPPALLLAAEEPAEFLAQLREGAEVEGGTALLAEEGPVVVGVLHQRAAAHRRDLERPHRMAVPVRPTDQAERDLGPADGPAQGVRAGMAEGAPARLGGPGPGLAGERHREAGG